MFSTGSSQAYDFFLKIATHISYVGNKIDRLLGVENKKVHCENNDEINN